MGAMPPGPPGNKTKSKPPDYTPGIFTQIWPSPSVGHNLGFHCLNSSIFKIINLDIFFPGNSHKPSLGHVRCLKRFGLDRFSRFYVYWIQTNNRQAKYGLLLITKIKRFNNFLKKLLLLMSLLILYLFFLIVNSKKMFLKFSHCVVTRSILYKYSI